MYNFFYFIPTFNRFLFIFYQRFFLSANFIVTKDILLKVKLKIQSVFDFCFHKLSLVFKILQLNKFYSGVQDIHQSDKIRGKIKRDKKKRWEKYNLPTITIIINVDKWRGLIYIHKIIYEIKCNFFFLVGTIYIKSKNSVVQELILNLTFNK